MINSLICLGFSGLLTCFLAQRRKLLIDPVLAKFQETGLMIRTFKAEEASIIHELGAGALIANNKDAKSLSATYIKKGYPIRPFEAEGRIALLYDIDQIVISHLFKLDAMIQDRADEEAYYSQDSDSGLYIRQVPYETFHGRPFLTDYMRTEEAVKEKRRFANGSLDAINSRLSRMKEKYVDSGQFECLAENEALIHSRNEDTKKESIIGVVVIDEISDDRLIEVSRIVSTIRPDLKFYKYRPGKLERLEEKRGVDLAAFSQRIKKASKSEITISLMFTTLLALASYQRSYQVFASTSILARGLLKKKSIDPIIEKYKKEGLLISVMSTSPIQRVISANNGEFSATFISEDIPIEPDYSNVTGYRMPDVAIIYDTKHLKIKRIFENNECEEEEFLESEGKDSEEILTLMRDSFKKIYDEDKAEGYTQLAPNRIIVELKDKKNMPVVAIAQIPIPSDTYIFSRWSLDHSIFANAFYSRASPDAVTFSIKQTLSKGSFDDFKLSIEASCGRALPVYEYDPILGKLHKKDQSKVYTKND